MTCLSRYATQSNTPTEIQKFKSKRRTLEDSQIYRSGFSAAGAQIFTWVFDTLRAGQHSWMSAKVSGFSGRGATAKRYCCLCDSWGYASSSSGRQRRQQQAGFAVGAATWQHVAICQLCMYKILCNIMAHRHRHRPDDTLGFVFRISCELSGVISDWMLTAFSSNWITGIFGAGIRGWGGGFFWSQLRTFGSARSHSEHNP